MATQAYYNWVNDGKPFTVARPIRAVGSKLQAYGYTVYYIGNDAHLKASTPEDHTPFSFTGWPGSHPYPYVNALDIMPPPSGSGLPSLQVLGATLLADKKAGYPGTEWLKYFNWEPEGDNKGPCYRESFKGSYVRYTSSDRGHIHGSGRTDFVSSGVADSYDLVARARGVQATGGVRLFTVQINGQAAIFLSDGFKYKGVADWDTYVRLRDGAGVRHIVVPSSAAFALLAGEQDIAGPDPVQLTAAQMAELAEAARRGAAEGSAGASADEVREIVDSELDEAFHAGADDDN